MTRHKRKAYSLSLPIKSRLMQMKLSHKLLNSDQYFHMEGPGSFKIKQVAQRATIAQLRATK